MYSAYKLNKQGDNIQPWRTPFPTFNQSIVPCPVLTVAICPANRFLRRQVSWSGIPISDRTWSWIIICWGWGCLVGCWTLMASYQLHAIISVVTTKNVFRYCQTSPAATWSLSVWTLDSQENLGWNWGLDRQVEETRRRKACAFETTPSQPPWTRAT